MSGSASTPTYYESYPRMETKKQTFELSRQRTAHFEMIQNSVGDIVEETRYLAKQLPQIKSRLKPHIRTLKGTEPYSKISAVDGSNTPHPVEVVAYSFFGYSAAVVHDGMAPPWEGKVAEDMVERHKYNSYFPQLLREREELRTILHATKESPELIIADGSILSIATWRAKKMESKSGSVMPDRFEKVYQECYDSTDPQSLYNQVYDLMKRFPLIYMPEAGQSRVAMRAYLNDEYVGKELPDYVRDVRVLSRVLKPGQYLEPVNYHESTTRPETESFARKYTKDIMFTYFQPVKGRPSIKLEFYKNKLGELDRILNTVLASYNPRANAPEQLFAAHKRAKGILPTLNNVVRFAQKIAMRRCETLEEMNQVYTAFQVIRPMKRF